MILAADLNNLRNRRLDSPVTVLDNGHVWEALCGFFMKLNAHTYAIEFPATKRSYRFLSFFFC